MKTKLLALAAIAFSLLPGRGENVLSESFSTYPNGAIVGAPGSPWANNTGTAGSMLASNASLEINAGRSEDISAPLSRMLTNTTDTAAYASFNIRVLSLPSIGGAYMAHFISPGPAGLFRGRVWLSITNVSVSGKIRIGIGNSSASSSASTPWPAELDTNVVYKVVTRFDLTTGICTLWINPTSEADPSISDASTPAGAQAISSYGFRQATGEGVSRINDLRVGSTFADVAGANAPPSISAFPTIIIPANGSAGPVSFTIADSETPVAALILSRTSTNATLLPTNNIVFGGSGGSRNVTFTPVAAQEGASQVAITVTDGNGATATTTFLVIVGAPSISDIPNQVTPTNVPLTGIAFTVTDAETPNSLNVTATSTNQTLLSDANIIITGTGSSRTLSLTPFAGQAGLTLVTVTVSDGTQTASDTFLLTVFPNLGLIINEPFSYPNGTQIADPVNFPTPWLHHSGSNAQTLVNGGKVGMSATNTEDFNLELRPSPNLTFTPQSGVILYASFVVNFSLVPTSGGDYFAHYKDTGTINFRGRVFSSAQGAVAGQFRLGVANTAASIGTNGLHPTFLTTNQTYKVVTRYNVGTDETTLWINPSSEGSAKVTATDAATAITADSFALRQNTGIGNFTFDDLKVGTKFADVSDVVASYSLKVAKSGPDVVVFWPTAATGFTLQSATDLTLSNWVNVGTAPTVVGSENFVTNTSPAGNAFFRLKN